MSVLRNVPSRVAPGSPVGIYFLGAGDLTELPRTRASPEHEQKDNGQQDDKQETGKEQPNQKEK